MRFAVGFLGALLITSSALAQAPTAWLHVSSGGVIVDDTNHPVFLRGLNRSGTGSGNADALTTDQDYAAANKLLSMNLVRLFVNAVWWTTNVTVPIGNIKYQDYLDQVIQRAKKYGNYVLIVKAGQFPDAPCGADGKNCPLPNQGDLNCQSNAALCPVEDTSGTYTDSAFQFWSAFAKRYGTDPAVLYDTWEDMHGIPPSVWSDAQNQLIAAIRTYSPRSLIFVEDVSGAFDAIAQGQLADLAWPNVVWNFHLYNGFNGTVGGVGCTEPVSPRYNNFSQNLDPLAAYARQHGHGFAITEWGGCNDNEPYHTNITSYAQAHQVTLAYFDAPNAITQSGGQDVLTPNGMKVQQAYASIGASVTGTTASINSASGSTTLAPEMIAAAFGTNLSPQTQAVTTLPLPLSINGTSVLVTDANGVGRLAELFLVSSGQINYQVPPGTGIGTATVAVENNGAITAAGSAQIATTAPGLYTGTGNGQGPAAAIAIRVHANGAQDSSLTFQCSSPTNCSTVPIDLGAATDQLVLLLFGTGIRGRSSEANVTCRIGTTTLPVQYAYVQGEFAGLDQINVLLPRSLAGSGERDLVLTVDGQASNTVRINIR